MKNLKRNLKEGLVFTFPLGENYGMGVLARTNGHFGLGYFYECWWSKRPGLEECWKEIETDSLADVRQFGFLGFKDDSWRVLGEFPEWDRADWVVPGFLSICPITGTHRLVLYDDDLNDLGMRNIEKSHDMILFNDGLYGHLVVEKQLSRKFREIGLPLDK
jgi:hypothetical protein